MVPQHSSGEGAHHERHVPTSGGGRDWTLIGESQGVWSRGVVNGYTEKGHVLEVDTVHAGVMVIVNHRCLIS